MPVRSTIMVLEYAETAKPAVDREAGVIRGVKVLGLQSKHGYSYPAEVLKRSLPLYEGVPVFVDHPSLREARNERSVSEQFGCLEGVRLESDGIYADLHFLKSHPMSEQVCELAERFPDKIGLSHNADVTRTQESEVSSIDRVRSVDLVCRPATARGIFESEERMEPNAMATQATPAVEETPAPVEANPVDAAIDALEAQYLPKIREPGADKATRKKLAQEFVKKIQTVVDALAEDEEPPECDGEGEEVPAEECSGKESVAKDAKPTWQGAMLALESGGVKVTTARVAAYVALESDELRKAFIADQKSELARSGGAKPKSTPAAGSAVLEAERGKLAGKDPTKDDLKSFARSLLR